MSSFALAAVPPLSCLPAPSLQLSPAGDDPLTDLLPPPPPAREEAAGAEKKEAGEASLSSQPAAAVLVVEEEEELDPLTALSLQAAEEEDELDPLSMMMNEGMAASSSSLSTGGGGGGGSSSSPKGSGLGTASVQGIYGKASEDRLAVTWRQKKDMILKDYQVTSVRVSTAFLKAENNVEDEVVLKQVDQEEQQQSQNAKVSLGGEEGKGRMGTVLCFFSCLLAFARFESLPAC